MAGIISTSAKVSVFCGNHEFCLTVTGDLSRGDIIRITEEYYSLVGDRDILWDIRGCNVSTLTDADFDQIAPDVAAQLKPTAHRKIACVVADAAAYTRVCKYITTAFELRVPAEYSAFLDIELARQWLAHP